MDSVLIAGERPCVSNRNGSPFRDGWPPWRANEMTVTMSARRPDDRGLAVVIAHRRAQEPGRRGRHRLQDRYPTGICLSPASARWVRPEGGLYALRSHSSMLSFIPSTLTSAGSPPMPSKPSQTPATSHTSSVHTRGEKFYTPPLCSTKIKTPASLRDCGGFCLVLRPSSSLHFYPTVTIEYSGSMPPWLMPLLRNQADQIPKQEAAQIMR